MSETVRGRPRDKRKRIPFENVATETTANTWEFDLAGFKWRWRGVTGLNLFIVGPTGTEYPVAYVRKVEEAGMFAEGFVCGISYQKKIAENKALERAGK